MQMHHRACIRPGVIKRPMHKHFLGRLIPGDVLKIQIQLGNPRRIQPAERRIGRRHQIAVNHLNTDIPSTAYRKSAREQAGT